jgi:threonine/homoserine/homoserine lactone efflux protein
LFKTAPWIYLSLKLLGGTYLIYLGVKLIISNTRAGSNHRVSFSTNIDPIQGYKLGLLTNLSNPKTAAFVTSLFAATMPSNAPFWLGFMSVALMFLISILWYTSVAYVFSLDRFRSLYLKSRIWIERFAGAIFIGFGMKLVASE